MQTGIHLLQMEMKNVQQTKESVKGISKSEKGKREIIYCLKSAIVQYS